MDKAKDLQMQLEQLCNGQEAVCKQGHEEVAKVLLCMAGQMLAVAQRQEQPVGGGLPSVTININNSGHIVSINGNNSIATISGNVAVGSNRVAMLEMLVKEKDRLLEEKERTIKILMSKLQDAKDRGFV